MLNVNIPYSLNIFCKVMCFLQPRSNNMSLPSWPLSPVCYMRRHLDANMSRTHDCYAPLMLQVATA